MTVHSCMFAVKGNLIAMPTLAKRVSALPRLALSAFACLVMAFPATAAQKLNLFAASSLSVVLPELAESFEQQHQVKINVVYGGSGQLARQIDYGADAHLFISANRNWSDYLLKSSRVTAKQAGNVATNHLVVVASNRTFNSSGISFEPSNLSWWSSQLKRGRLAVGETNSVPVGMYAKQSLIYLGVWPQLMNQLAPAKSTRSTLALVERGQAPLGIVYASDALLSDAVTILGALDSKSYENIEYPMLALSDLKEVQQLADFLLSENAQASIQSHGFSQ